MSGLPKSRVVRRGLIGIERSIETKNLETNEKISLAFQDIKSLMEMAKPMVELIHKISDVQKEMQGDEVPEDELKEFRQNLLSLGVKVKDPVTKSKYGKDEYFRKLAIEISNTLSDEIERRGGIMPLVEVYVCLNRARGVNLVSPEDVFNACQLLNKLNLAISLKEYGKGLQVLQHDCFSDEFCKSTILSFLDTQDWITSEKYAEIAGIPLHVARHILLMVEKQSLVCRDESIEGIRFYPIEPILFNC